MLVEKTVREFTHEVASASAAPGGGSVAALAGALGAALMSMVCRLTIGKKKYADVQEEMESVLEFSEDLRAKFSALVDEDTDAFNGVMRAFALPKDTAEQISLRSAAIQDATKRAALIPLEVMRLCGQAMLLAETTAQKGNINSISDAGVSAEMLRAACVGASLNVQINLATLQDQKFVKETTETFNRIMASVKEIHQRIQTRVQTALQ